MANLRIFLPRGPFSISMFVFDAAMHYLENGRKFSFSRDLLSFDTMEKVLGAMAYAGPIIPWKARATLKSFVAVPQSAEASFKALQIPHGTYYLKDLKANNIKKVVK